MFLNVFECFSAVIQVFSKRLSFLLATGGMVYFWTLEQVLEVVKYGVYTTHTLHTIYIYIDLFFLSITH